MKKEKKKEGKGESRGGGKAEADKETKQQHRDSTWPSIKIFSTDFHSKCLGLKEKQVNIKE